MNCPKCKKEMRITCFAANCYKEGVFNVEEVIGRCDDCDFDASWEQLYVGESYELVTTRNFRKYFFG